MTVELILEIIDKAGLTLGLTNTDSIKVTPRELITPSIRELINNNKVELVTALGTRSIKIEKPVTEIELEHQLLEAAMLASDFWGDSQAARFEMIADIKTTPLNKRQELLEHFLAAYGKAK